MDGERVGRRRGSGRGLCIGAAVLFGAVLCVAGVSIFFFVSGPPGNWRDPPIYPGAKQLDIQDFGSMGQRVPDVAGVFLMRVTTFHVADPPEKVREFYSRAYSGDR